MFATIFKRRYQARISSARCSTPLLAIKVMPRPSSVLFDTCFVLEALAIVLRKLAFFISLFSGPVIVVLYLTSVSTHAPWWGSWIIQDIPLPVSALLIASNVISYRLCVFWVSIIANGHQESLTSSSNKTTTYITYDSSFTCSDGTSLPTIVVPHSSAQHAVLPDNTIVYLIANTGFPLIASHAITFHTLYFFAIPPSRLNVKVGGMYRIMRNFSIDRGLVKNARVVVTDIGVRLICVRLLRNSTVDNEDILLPQITFTSHLPSGHILIRKQFPIAPAYATTFNGCQGLTGL